VVNCTGFEIPERFFKVQQENAGNSVICIHLTVMRHYRVCLILSVMILALSCSVIAQSWNFIKEKDGVKLYTQKETGKSLKSYKGVADIKAPADKVFAMIEDVNHTEWWDKNLNQIRVMLYEKNKRARYYLIYNLPWPVTDRDLCVDVKVTIDPVTGESKLTASPLPGLVPARADMIRITEYRQTWTVRPAGKNQAHVELEGFVDPAGSIPDWICNMIIVDSPLKAMSEIRRRMEKQ
jgi:hypothetical protein